MGYKKKYNQRKKRKLKLKWKLLIVFGIMLGGATWFIYMFDRIVTPTVMAVSEADMKAKSLKVMNSSVLEEFSDSFDYNEVIDIQKENDGSISLIKADIIKLNSLASKVALRAQSELNELGNVGIKLPIGYITKNNILSYLGPPITVKMQPIGYVEAMYESEFESAGINQTRHKIFVNLKCKVKIIIPLRSREVEVKHRIAVAETIIVGDVPETAMQLDFDRAGFNLNSGLK